MKGRRDGRIMNVYSKVPGYEPLASIAVLLRTVRQRFQWFDYCMPGGMPKGRHKAISFAAMLPQA